jgi:hypothetical protein
MLSVTLPRYTVEICGCLYWLCWLCWMCVLLRLFAAGVCVPKYVYAYTDVLFERCYLSPRLTSHTCLVFPSHDSLLMTPYSWLPRWMENRIHAPPSACIRNRHQRIL